MRVYSLTELGRKVTSASSDSSEDMRVLNYIRENKTVTDNELDIVGGRHIARRLARRGLVKELTS